MKSKITKILSVLLVSIICISTASAASAKVTYVKGKVEVNRRGSWIQLKVGDLVQESETISTGFQSEARLNLNGSVLAVAALTRVKIETLKTSETTDTVSLYQDTGATRSKVTHTENKKVDYRTRTAVAVASVRGTDYAIFSIGKMSTKQGKVNFSPVLKDLNKAGKSVLVNKGNISKVDKTGKTNTPNLQITQNKNNFSKGIRKASDQDGANAFDNDEQTTSVIVKIRF